MISSTGFIIFKHWLLCSSNNIYFFSNGNIISKRVLEKVGFKYKGYFVKDSIKFLKYEIKNAY